MKQKRPAPITKEDSQRAFRLVGERILCARDPEGLGSYATLVDVLTGEDAPFAVILENPCNTNRIISRCSCIVEDTTYTENKS